MNKSSGYLKYAKIWSRISPPSNRFNPMPARYCSRKLRSRLICASASQLCKSVAPAGVRGEHIEWAVKSDLAQRMFHFFVVGSLPTSFQFFYVDSQRCIVGFSQHDGIVTFAIEIVAPNGAVREHLEERGHFAFHYRRRAFIKRHPLRDHAAGVQVSAHRLEILLGVERSGPFHPGMDRIGRNDVELFLGCQQIMPGIVVVNFHARIIYHIVILLGENTAPLCWG